MLDKCFEISCVLSLKFNVWLWRPPLRGLHFDPVSSGKHARAPKIDFTPYAYAAIKRTVRLRHESLRCVQKCGREGAPKKLPVSLSAAGRQRDGVKRSRKSFRAIEPSSPIY